MSITSKMILILLLFASMARADGLSGGIGSFEGPLNSNVIGGGSGPAAAGGGGGGGGGGCAGLLSLAKGCTLGAVP